MWPWPCKQHRLLRGTYLKKLSTFWCLFVIFPLRETRLTASLLNQHKRKCHLKCLPLCLNPKIPLKMHWKCKHKIFVKLQWGIKTNKTYNNIEHYTNSNFFSSFRQIIFHSDKGAVSNKKGSGIALVSILYMCLASYDLPLSSSVANSSVRKVAVVREAIVRLTACECFGTAEELTAAPAARWGQYCDPCFHVRVSKTPVRLQHLKSCQEGLERSPDIARKSLSWQHCSVGVWLCFQKKKFS